MSLVAASVVFPTLGLAASPAASPTPLGNCEQAEILRTLGRPAAAVQAFTKGLAVRADEDCAMNGLADLQGSGELCAQADALVRLGRDADAVASYKKLLDTTPRLSCAVNGLHAADESFFSWLSDAVSNSGNVLAALGVLFALVTMMAGIARRVLIHAPRIRGWRIFRRWVRPLVRIGDLGDTAAEHLGPGTLGVLKLRLMGSGSQAVDLAAGDVSTDLISTLADTGSQAKAVAAIAAWMRTLLGRRLWSVEGELQADGRDGPGITVRLHGKGRVSRLAEFWTDDFGDDAPAIPGPAAIPTADDYRELAVPAAAWLRHQLLESVGDAKSLGTRSADSYALFDTGLFWQDRGRRALAEKLYRRARVLDEHNVGATGNLGVLLAEDGDPEGIWLLEKALAMIES